jgi:hypothetical protein
LPTTNGADRGRTLSRSPESGPAEPG